MYPSPYWDPWTQLPSLNRKGRLPTQLEPKCSTICRESSNAPLNQFQFTDGFKGIFWPGVVAAPRPPVGVVVSSVVYAYELIPIG